MLMDVCLQGPRPRKPHKPHKPRKPHKPHKPQKLLSPSTHAKRAEARARSAINQVMLKLAVSQKPAMMQADAKRMALVLVEKNMTPRNKTQLRSPEYSKLINNGARVSSSKADQIWLELQKLRSP